MKRKATSEEDDGNPRKKALLDINGAESFREALFNQVDTYQKQYAAAKPYKHGVIKDLLEPILLRNVRSEIQQNLSFTPKETDIYRIYQSGDLANLDGLDDSSLKLLPSLLELRNALYSAPFRDFLSTITDFGPLSGKKKDMAINVYTPGCHLLCHDDVIGSRRVSYILYLTDPDQPWQKEWGGALRLYPTFPHIGKDGQLVKVPSPDASVSIPPSFNQLSFFAVQPGESFHDVEEVYAKHTGTDEAGDDIRVRMAISGWYHIPQEGEEGYVEGLEESLAEKSSLTQLQGAGDQYDQPQEKICKYERGQRLASGADLHGDSSLAFSKDALSLSEAELEFLLKFIAPTYLTPDTLDSVSELFTDQCSLCLETFLSHSFAETLRAFIIDEESRTPLLSTKDVEAERAWKVSRPPHKHRFLFQQASEVASSKKSALSPIEDLLETLIPSEAFRKWLQLATGLIVTSHDALARRFRRGNDYALATGYSEDEPRLEIILAITPTSGWDEDGSEVIEEASTSTEQDEQKQKSQKATSKEDQVSDSAGVGGYVAYMTSEDIDDDASGDHGSDHGVEIPTQLSTGARASGSSNPNRKKLKADPAIYQSQADDEEDGVLFSMPAGWNRLGIVLRDRGVMRFVKYVSRRAKGDRWDLFGEFGVFQNNDDDDDNDSNEENQRSQDERLQKSNIEEDETDINTSGDDDTDES
ncbi:MAG: hypothetical protein Q9167_005618 [Letrouitia subvulpina]